MRSGTLQLLSNKMANIIWMQPFEVTQEAPQHTTTGVFLLNSLMADFAALLHSRIDTKYCSDGALLLHTMCQHIHRNHLAFTESIKSKIRASLLSNFNNDVSKFLRHLHNNLKLISSTGDTENAHNDLITHILTQLRGTTIPIFQQSVLKWQCEYFENKLTLTPQLLVSKADSECQILTHAGQWVKTIDNAQSGEILKAMIANFSQIHQQTRDSTRSYRHATRPSIRASNQQTPIWVNDPPTYPDQIRHHNGRYWHFCTKCGSHGRWVCTHTDSTHDDSVSSRRSPTPDTNDPHYRLSRSPSWESSSHHRRRSRQYDSRSRSRSPSNHSYSSQQNSPQRRVTWQQAAPPTPVAKLSLLESINLFMDNNE